MEYSSLREAPSCGQKHLYHRNSCKSADLCMPENDTGNETKGGYCHYLNVIYDKANLHPLSILPSISPPPPPPTSLLS